MPAKLTHLILLALTVSAANVDASEPVQSWIESNVPELMRDAMMPGFAIAVVQNGEIAYKAAFGARDRERALPATADTLFGIGSVTKSFVAIGILQLAEQGKLDLDDPVSKYVPFELGSPEAPIRIRHLLTHSPGYPNLASSTVMISRGLGEDTGVPMSSAEDFYRFVNGAKAEIIFAPGEHFFYNNSAWRLLGAIIQEVSGQPFHEYVTSNILRPLGMRRSTMDTAELFDDPDHLTPYLKTDEGIEPANFPYPNPADNPGFSFLSAAGGISSSVSEMALYLNMLMDNGQTTDGRLISGRSMRDMQTLHIAEPDEYYGKTGYGYGIGITPDFLGEKLVDHGGSISVSTAKMAIVPERKIGVVMMGNGSGMNYSLIAEAVLAILLGKDPESSVPALVVRNRMKSFEGQYDVYRSLSTVEIAVTNGMLQMTNRRWGNQSVLIPVDPGYQGMEFYVLNGGRKTPIYFRENTGGHLSVLVGRYVYHRR